MYLEFDTSAPELHHDDVVDCCDVPYVGARELALTLKMLSGQGLLVPEALTDLDLRQVEHAFWQISRRSRQRKVAVLLRFRSFVAACKTRRVSELIAVHGHDGLIQALEVAAKMRLNAKWGFNPHKLARAIREAMPDDATVPRQGQGAALAA